MSNTRIGILSPVHFPNMQSPFSGQTHRDATCDCFGSEFVQKFHCTDRIVFHVTLFHPLAGPKIYIVDEDGARISSAILPTPIDLSNRYFDIDLSTYCNQKIAFEYTEELLFVETTIDTSEYIYVTSEDDCVSCTRLITYDGDCREFNTNYGPTAGSPLFTHQLRLNASFDIASEITGGEYFKNSLSEYDSCGIEVEEVWRLNISFVPSWMQRKLMYIFRSKRIYIDGTRYVPEGSLNVGQTADFLKSLDILLKPQQAYATLTGCN